MRYVLEERERALWERAQMLGGEEYVFIESDSPLPNFENFQPTKS